METEALTTRAENSLKLDSGRPAGNLGIGSKGSEDVTFKSFNGAQHKHTRVQPGGTFLLRKHHQADTPGKMCFFFFLNSWN